jgi:hypothetical protein
MQHLKLWVPKSRAGEGYGAEEPGMFDAVTRQYLLIIIAAG